MVSFEKVVEKINFHREYQAKISYTFAPSKKETPLAELDRTLRTHTETYNF